jgi:hypothetical protein
MEKNPPGKIVFCQITLPTFRGGKREREIGTALAITTVNNRTKLTSGKQRKNCTVPIKAPERKCVEKSKATSVYFKMQ